MNRPVEARGGQDALDDRLDEAGDDEEPPPRRLVSGQEVGGAGAADGHRSLGAAEGEPYGVFAGDRKPQRMNDDLEWLDVQSFCQSGSSVSVPLNPERVTETA